MIPTISEEEEKILPRKIKLKDEIPNPANIPKGCRFSTRCPYKKEVCNESEPGITKTGSHEVRCHFVT